MAIRIASSTIIRWCSRARQLLQLNADFEVVATCGTAVEGLQTGRGARPDVLLLDPPVRSDG
jgi:DNA-binding NarL/FixJ family response regulator